ncbi:hypothetical protein FB451DRAFT_1216256 [Mycena latifolia]|nr:hypothetical protein FB451DRAFT_1216256 [Mycena latifolia]
MKVIWTATRLLALLRPVQLAMSQVESECSPSKGVLTRIELVQRRFLVGMNGQVSLLSLAVDQCTVLRTYSV